MNIAQFTFTVRSGRAKTTQIVAGSGELTVNSTLREAANDAVMNESHDESYYRQQNLKTLFFRASNKYEDEKSY